MDWDQPEIEQALLDLHLMVQGLERIQELLGWLLFVAGLFFGWQMLRLVWLAYHSIEFGGGVMPRWRGRP